MTAAIYCEDCGEELFFNIIGEEKYPTTTCDCGATYKMRVTKVQ